MTTDKQIQEAAIEIGRKGHVAMLDEIIEKHLKKVSQPPFTSSVYYFADSGIVSGSFLNTLRNMLEDYGKICEESMQSQSQWIPVDESVLYLVEFEDQYSYAKISFTDPFDVDCNGDMLVQLKYEDGSFKAIQGMDGWGNSITDEIIGKIATVFMPLPEPPKAE